MIPREFNYSIQLGLQNQQLQDLLFQTMNPLLKNLLLNFFFGLFSSSFQVRTYSVALTLFLQTLHTYRLVKKHSLSRVFVSLTVTKIYLNIYICIFFNAQSFSYIKASPSVNFNSFFKLIAASIIQTG